MQLSDPRKKEDPASVSADLGAETSARKRSKTGCLSCRKQRIKCDEQRPGCANCIGSKRRCEGYTKRIGAKQTNTHMMPMNAPSLKRWSGARLDRDDHAEVLSQEETSNEKDLGLEKVVEWEDVAAKKDNSSLSEDTRLGEENQTKPAARQDQLEFVVIDHPNRLKGQAAMGKNRQLVMNDYLVAGRDHETPRKQHAESPESAYTGPPKSGYPAFENTAGCPDNQIEHGKTMPNIIQPEQKLSAGRFESTVEA